jgi:WD40 repeat protein
MTDDERQLHPLCMATLGGHTDYVKALATGMENQTLFASAGLDGQVIFWDIQRLRSTWTNIHLKHTGRDPCINESWTTPPDAIESSSIYCVDVDQTCTLAAVGTTDKRIYLWDRRMKRCIGSLCGHIGNIRKVALSGDGKNALSCSSDGTVRKWSIGQLDCVDVFRLHDDSVWTLCADKNLQTVYTGGRDRCIYRLNPTTRAHELIAR